MHKYSSLYIYACPVWCWFYRNFTAFVKFTKWQRVNCAKKPVPTGFRVKTGPICIVQSYTSIFWRRENQGLCQIFPLQGTPGDKQSYTSIREKFGIPILYIHFGRIAPFWAGLAGGEWAAKILYIYLHRCAVQQNYSYTSALGYQRSPQVFHILFHSS